METHHSFKKLLLSIFCILLIACGGKKSDVHKIVINPTLLTLIIDHTYPLQATALDAKGNTIKGIDFNWRSSDEKIATVNKVGLVYAKSEGIVNIYIQTNDAVSFACVIDVVDYSMEKQRQAEECTLRATLINQSELTLQWTAHANSFVVERKTDSDEKFKELIKTTENSYVDKTFDSRFNYTYQIKRILDEEKINYSNAIRIPRENFVPLNFDMTPVSQHEICITWNHSYIDVESFQIERADTNGAYYKIGTVSADSNSFIDANTEIGFSYHYRVAPHFRDYDISSPSEKSIYFTISPPQMESVELISSAEVRLRWRYSKQNRYIKTDCLIQRAVNNSSFINLSQVSSAATEFIDRKIELGNVYHYRIQAVTQSYESESSNKKSIDLILPAPEILSSPTHSENSVIIQWAYTPKFMITPHSFVIRKKTTNDDILVQLVSIANDQEYSFTDIAVESNKSYQYQVAAHFNNGYETESQIKTASFDKNNFTLSWEKSANGKTNCLAYSPDNKYIAIGSSDCSLTIWDVLNGNLVWSGKHDKEVNSIRFSPQGNRLLSTGSDNKLKVWHSITGALLWTGTHKIEVYTAVFSPNGEYVASGGCPDLKLWKTANGELVWTEVHSGCIKSIAFTTDGSFIVSGSWDMTLKVWDVQNRENIWTGTHGGFVKSVAISPDNRLVASGSYDKSVKIWDIKNGTKLWSAMHGSSVNSVAFSNDGSMLASASGDEAVSGQLTIWNVTDFSLRWRKSNEGGIFTAVFDPNGEIIATGDYNRTIKIWKVDNGTLLWLGKHQGNVSELSFSPDGSTLTSAGNDIKVWRRKGGWLMR